jgi:hypothetical protein
MAATAGRSTWGDDRGSPEPHAPSTIASQISRTVANVAAAHRYSADRTGAWRFAGIERRFRGGSAYRRGMGWSVYYRGVAEAAITSDERDVLAAHVATWSPKLHDGSEPYGWSVEDGGTVLSGTTKIHYSSDKDADFVTLVHAAQELEALLPRFTFEISDDYIVTEGTLPSEVEPE